MPASCGHDRGRARPGARLWADPQHQGGQGQPYDAAEHEADRDPAADPPGAAFQVREAAHIAGYHRFARPSAAGCRVGGSRAIAR